MFLCSFQIYTHDSFDSLLEHVPQDVLPSDYGGQERSSDELCGRSPGTSEDYLNSLMFVLKLFLSCFTDLWQEKLVSYREYFLSTEKIRSTEALRQDKRKDHSFSSSLDGAFRKLDID